MKKYNIITSILWMLLGGLIIYLFFFVYKWAK
ncbi:hypothetical protein [Clostridium tertium]